MSVGGSSLPAVRVELNPSAMFKYGVGLEDVRAALAAANANSPKGAIENATLHWQIYDNDQSRSAKDYHEPDRRVPQRLARAADTTSPTISDSVEDIRNLGLSKGQPAVLVVISRQPQANIIETVDRVRALLPQLQANIPPATAARGRLGPQHGHPRLAARRRELARDRDHPRRPRRLRLPARRARGADPGGGRAGVPRSGTFGAMYLLGYSLDNLSLMALTIATGFVVDDAIVVMENIVRHMESGVPRFQAALIGVRQVGFTVLSMSLSLIAVFIPILLMGGVVGPLLPRVRGHALGRDPHLDGHLAHDDADDVRPAAQRPPQVAAAGRASTAGARTSSRRCSPDYRRSLTWVLRPQAPDALRARSATVALNVWLFTIIPKGFFPEQDTGRMFGFIQADQSISFQRISQKLRQYVDHRPGRQGRRRRRRLHRGGRRGRQLRQDVHLAQAPRPAKGARRSRS